MSAIAHNFFPDVPLEGHSVEALAKEFKKFYKSKEKGALLSRSSTPASTGSSKKELVYSKFGKTKKVIAELYHMTPEEEPEQVYWVERGEDYYGIRKGVRTAVVTREAFLRGEDVSTGGKTINAKTTETP